MKDSKPYPYKDCPFCGGKAFGHQSVQGEEGYFVECIKCWVKMAAGTKAALLRKWNKRVKP